MGTFATKTGAGSRQARPNASAASAPRSAWTRSSSHAGSPKRWAALSAMNEAACSPTRRSTAFAKPAALLARHLTSSTPWLTAAWGALSRKSIS